MDLSKLGNRICIIGPSSSGKSTLAKNLGEKLNLKILHLDQLAHVPNTNWKPRPKEDFREDHDLFLNNNQSWVIDGNYSAMMESRFACATAIIWLDFSISGALWRYFKRSLNHKNDRAGNLEGASQQFSWKLVKHITIVAPKNRGKYIHFIKQSNAQLLHVKSFSELKKYYKIWEL